MRHLVPLPVALLVAIPRLLLAQTTGRIVGEVLDGGVADGRGKIGLTRTHPEDGREDIPQGLGLPRRFRLWPAVALNFNRHSQRQERARSERESRRGRIGAMATAKASAQIHAALAYYYDNREEIDAELAADKSWAESLNR